MLLHACDDAPPQFNTHHTGIWSQIKRAPTSVRKRLTYEVPGPSVAGAMPLDARARQIFRCVCVFVCRVGLCVCAGLVRAANTHNILLQLLTR